MAIMHPYTTMSPTKLELIAAWLPSQPWFAGDAAAIERLAEYRLDDPEGEVGLNGVLVTAGDDTVYHVPLTYRDAPLEGCEAFSLGTSEHGVLGTRWVTFGLADPVFRQVLAQTIAQGASGAVEHIQDAEGNMSTREVQVPLQGSGSAGAAVPEMWSGNVSSDEASSLFDTGLSGLRIIHAPATAAGAAAGLGAAQTLTATWPGQETPVTIATLS